jgi:hypothetical protein
MLQKFQNSIEAKRFQRKMSSDFGEEREISE